MRTINFQNKEYPVSVTGDTVIIFSDELKRDIFKTMRYFLTEMASNRMPPIDITANMVYAAIKTANPDMFKTYKDFMSSTTRLDTFVDVKMLDSLLAEYNEAFGFNEAEEEQAEGNSEVPKKK